MTQHQEGIERVSVQQPSVTPPVRRSAGPVAAPPAVRGPVSWGQRLGTGGSTALLGVAGGADFLLHALAGRAFGPTEYGALAALLGLAAALTVPLSALQTLTSAAVVRDLERGRSTDTTRLLLRMVLAAALVAALLAPAARPLADALHLRGTAPALLTLALLVPTAACAVLWARLYGIYGLPGVAVPVTLGSLTRCSVAAVLMARGGGPASVMAATVLGESVTALLLLAGVRTAVPAAAGRAALPLALGWRPAAAAVLTITGLWALTGVDLLWIRHQLPAAQAGSYAAGAFLAKAALFVAQGIVLVLLRRLASADRATSIRALRTGLGAALLAGAAVTAVLALGGRTVVPMLLGSSFVVGPQLGLCLGAAATMLLALTLLLHYHVTNGSSVTGGWVGILLFPVLAALMPRTAPGVAAALALASAAAVLLALRSLPELWSRPEAVEPPTGIGAGVGAGGGTGVGTGISTEISIVMPYYNPGPALRRQVLEVLAVLDGYGWPYEVLAVADGCTDGSERLLEDLSHPHLRLLSYPVNGGKGFAVRTGFAHARGRWLGFIDSDGDIPASHLTGLLDLARTPGVDAVVGSKWPPADSLPDPSTGQGPHSPVRRLCSVVFRRLTALLFRLPVQDTQTGLKVFRREVLSEVLPHCRENRFVFDLELLALLQLHRYRRVVQLPVAFRPRTHSTVGPAAVLLMLTDTLRLRLRLCFGPRRPVPVRRPVGVVAPALQLTLPAPHPGLQPVSDTRG